MSTDILKDLPTEKLTPDEEAAAVKARDHEKLILHNLREAVLYAGRCCRGAIEPGELLSLCYEALSKSAPRFRPNGITFLAYSKPDLRGEISRYWKTQNTVKNAYLHESPLPERIQIPTADPNTYDNSNETGFLADDVDTIEPDFVDFEFSAIALRERWSIVKPLLDAHLNDRERMILSLTYEAGFTFEKIAQMLVPSVCREAVRMAHERALRKLRNCLLRTKQLYGTL